MLVRTAGEIGSSATRVDVWLGKPANEAYAKFRELWKGADADIPTLKQAKAEAAKFH